MRYFLNGKSAKESQLHDFGLLQVELSEAVQCVIERHEIHAPLLSRSKGVLEHQRLPSATLRSLSLARILHEDLTHQLSANPKEMSAIFEVAWRLLHQAKIGFVNQSRGLQGVIWTFSAQVVVRQAAKLAVDQRQKPLQRLLIAGPPLG